MTPRGLPNCLQVITSSVADGNLDYRYDDPHVVRERRARFFEKAQMEFARSVWMSVTHGAAVQVVTKRDCGIGSESANGCLVDALITTDTGVTLALLTADCIPLVLCDPIQKVLALVHLGWKPTSLGLAQSVVEHMCAHGASPERVVAWMGPSIQKDSYLCESPTQKDDPTWKNSITHVRDSLYAVDLVMRNTELLQEAGVLSPNIFYSGIDTATDHTFFSHYRSTRAGEKEERFVTVATLV